jgi:flagellar biosynthesis GTPase FlhF
MSQPNGEGGARTFRGASLEELLPQIREELGPDALITRQRDGIVGGFGGFFGKKTVEVEAQPAGSPLSPQSATLSQPSRLDLYDTSEAEAETARPTTNRLLDELYRQASPFAERLTEAEQAVEESPEDFTRFEAPIFAEPETPILAKPEAPIFAEPEPEPEREPEAAPQVSRPAPSAPLADALALRAALLASGVPSALASTVLDEAELHMQPFDRLEPLSAHVRRALADRIKVKHGWTTARRTIAVVGPQGAGRTLAAVKLCRAYADGSGQSVAALSTEQARKALRLGTLAEQAGVDFEIADGPEAIAHVRRTLSKHRLVVADLPPVEAGDAASLDRVAKLLEALRPNETHLAVPASMSADSVRVLLLDLMARTKVHRLLVTHADHERGGGPVGASLASRVPVSYVSDGALPLSGIHPAQPDELAGMVLQ